MVFLLPVTAPPLPVPLAGVGRLLPALVLRVPGLVAEPVLGKAGPALAGVRVLVVPGAVVPVVLGIPALRTLLRVPVLGALPVGEVGLVLLTVPTVGPVPAPEDGPDPVAAAPDVP